MKTKILVTGAEGMFGSDLVSRLQFDERYEVCAVDIDDFDVTNLERVRDAMLTLRPQIVFHCAAYTAVDRAESEPLQAYRVNAGGTKNVAIFCRELQAEMYYISTDYVFNGMKDSPYTEEDEPQPLSTYGDTKYQGEQAVRALVPRHKICRTSWLCGVNGPNFIESILNLASRQKTISVVNDQIGRPTFTTDLCELLVQLLDVEESGLFHLTNDGYCSWYEFATRVIEMAGLDDVRVRPITSNEFRSMARRPKYTVMSNEKIRRLGLKLAPRWEDGLRRYLLSRRIEDSKVIF